MDFNTWWDDGIGKPVDIGYDCALMAWTVKDLEVKRVRARELELVKQVANMLELRSPFTHQDDMDSFRRALNNSLLNL